MNAFVPLPSRFHWTPQQLAGAVPLRLGVALAFAAIDHAVAANAASATARSRLRIAHGYRADAALPPRFRIS